MFIFFFLGLSPFLLCRCCRVNNVRHPPNNLCCRGHSWLPPAFSTKISPIILVSRDATYQVHNTCTLKKNLKETMFPSFNPLKLKLYWKVFNLLWYPFVLLVGSFRSPFFVQPAHAKQNWSDLKTFGCYYFFSSIPFSYSRKRPTVDRTDGGKGGSTLYDLPSTAKNHPTTITANVATTITITTTSATLYGVGTINLLTTKNTKRHNQDDWRQQDKYGSKIDR